MNKKNEIICDAKWMRWERGNGNLNDWLNEHVTFNRILFYSNLLTHKYMWNGEYQFEWIHFLYWFPYHFTHINVLLLVVYLQLSIYFSLRPSVERAPARHLSNRYQTTHTHTHIYSCIRVQCFMLNRTFY